VCKGTAAKSAGRSKSALFRRELTSPELSFIMEAHNGLSAKNKDKPAHRFFVTDSPRRFEDVGRRFLRSPMQAELITLEKAKEDRNK